MQPERQAPDSPAEWLNRAASDLVIAQTRIEGRYPGFDEPVTEDQWQRAVTQCKATLQWCRTAMAGGDSAAEREGETLP